MSDTNVNLGEAVEAAGEVTLFLETATQTVVVSGELTVNSVFAALAESANIHITLADQDIDVLTPDGEEYRVQDSGQEIPSGSQVLVNARNKNG